MRAIALSDGAGPPVGELDVEPHAGIYRRCRAQRFAAHVANQCKTAFENALIGKSQKQLHGAFDTGMAVRKESFEGAPRTIGKRPHALATTIVVSPLSLSIGAQCRAKAQGNAVESLPPSLDVRAQKQWRKSACDA